MIISTLVTLLLLILIVGIIAAITFYIVDLLPIDGRFKQIAKVVVLLICLLVILMKVLPLLDIALP